jgi:hypothetical protein
VAELAQPDQYLAKARDGHATVIRVRLATLLIRASGRTPYCARRLAVLRNSSSIVLLTRLTVRTATGIRLKIASISTEE